MSGRIDRPRLPDAVVERIRRERYAPSVLQCDYLHLRDLRDALVKAFAALPVVGGPVLDVFCGTQPYRELIPGGPVWGLDLDGHFGRTDVCAALPFPFADATFGLVVCTQALHLVDDPAATVREVARVLRPGGAVIVTVPNIFRREIPAERRLSPDDLRTLFAGLEATITGFGALGSALAYFPASLAKGAARRIPLLRWALPLAALSMNAVASIIDVIVTPMSPSIPASWILVARRTDNRQPSAGDFASPSVFEEPPTDLG